MITKKIKIINKKGLHARAASKFVEVSEQFLSEIVVKKSGKEVDGKNIMSLLMLAAAKGVEIEVVCMGEDEAEAIEAITHLISNSFDDEPD